MTATFADWPDYAAREFGRKSLVLRHRLAQSPLFDDAALIHLIEATPRENYHVNTMPREACDPHLWREGDMSGLSGEEVMAAVAKGFLWVHLQRVQEVGRAYRDMLDAAFEEPAAKRLLALRAGWTFARAYRTVWGHAKDFGRPR